MQGERGTTTNDKGYFYALNLPVGIYNVKISYVGKQTLTFENIIVQLGKTSTLGEIILKEEAEELSEVIVSSDKPVIDPGSTTIGLNLEQKVFENLFILHIMKISTLKVNGFMTKNDENVTTKCFKKTPLI